MKEERLLRLLGQVEEEWIEEAASERKKEKIGRGVPGCQSPLAFYWWCFSE